MNYSTELIRTESYKKYREKYWLTFDEFSEGVNNDEIVFGIRQTIDWDHVYITEIKLVELDEFALRAYYNMVDSSDCFRGRIEDGKVKVLVTVNVSKVWNTDERSGFTKKFASGYDERKLDW